MANGTIILTASGKLPSYLNGRIVWSSISNGTVANTSSVTAQLQISRNSSVATSGTWYGSFNVGGTTKKISAYASVGSGWVTIDTLTATVNHNADGSGSCYIYGLLNGPTETSMEGTSVSGAQTVTLDTIPRFAAIVSAPDFHDEENPTITYTNPAGSSVTTLEACISLDGAWADIAYRSISKTGSSYTFTLTEAELGVLRAATTGANSRQVLFCIRTAIGSSTGTSSLAKTFTVKDPAPTIAPIVKDSNSATIALTGDSSKLVRYYSNADITINASAVKGASLDSVTATCGNKSPNASGVIERVESKVFVFTARDNRGNTTTKTVTVPFVDYVKLTCNLGNEIPDAGGDMTVKATGNYFHGSFGAKSNTLQVCFRYKPFGGTYSDWTAMTVNVSGNSYAATADVTGLDYQTTYVFQTYAKDALATVYSAEKTVKAIPVFDWNEQDFRFHVPVYDQMGTLIGNSETQWQNPPLMPGVEYRTAERYNGKPVYMKLVDFGTLPNTSYKAVHFYSNETSRPIAVVGQVGASYEDLHLTVPNAFNGIDIAAVNYNQIRISTDSDRSGMYARALVKYWKRTD